MGRGAGRRSGDRRRRLVAPPARLQRPGRHDGRPRRATRPPLHRPARPRRRAVSHLVLGGALGLLHEPARRGRPGRGRVPRPDRRDARPRARHVRRGRARRRDDEVFLLTTTVCHPALANDNLSGIVLLAGLARILAAQDNLRHSFRLVWSPGTIGPLCWLQTNRDSSSACVTGSRCRASATPGP